MDDEVTARSVKGSPIIEIDPHFFFPESIIDLRYSNEIDDSSLTNYAEPPNLVDTSVQGSTFIIDGRLRPPSEITVINEAIRVLADGSQVIDITIEVTGDAINTDYNVRINKG